MNMVDAAKATMDRAYLAGMRAGSSPIKELDYDHLWWMVSQMREIEMSPSKMGRWLGWIQAAVVAANVGLSLEDMKNINRVYAND